MHNQIFRCGAWCIIQIPTWNNGNRTRDYFSYGCNVFLYVARRCLSSILSQFVIEALLLLSPQPDARTSIEGAKRGKRWKSPAHEGAKRWVVLVAISECLGDRHTEPWSISCCTIASPATGEVRTKAELAHALAIRANRYARCWTEILDVPQWRASQRATRIARFQRDYFYNFYKGYFYDRDHSRELPRCLINYTRIIT